MSEFYIGCRLSEIEAVYPNKGSDMKDYASTVRFKSGRELNLSPEWGEVVRKVESLLHENRAEESDRKWRKDSLESDIAALEARKAILEKVCLADFSQHPSEVALLAQWLTTRRPYLVADEKEALRKLLGIPEAA